MELVQKNILITGALGGIGKALTKEFEKQGANLILTDIKANPSVDHTYYKVDFTNRGEVLDLIENISNDFDRLDILINNAGIGVYKSLKDIKPEEWFNSYDVNVHAPFTLTKLLLPLLLKSSSPAVINVGSVCGVEPKNCRVAYNSTKFALRGLSLTLSEEFKNSKIKVTHLTLDSVLTDFGPTTIEQRKHLQKDGKNYLTPDFVAKSLVDKITSDSLEKEIKL